MKDNVVGLRTIFEGIDCEDVVNKKKTVQQMMNTVCSNNVEKKVQ